MYKMYKDAALTAHIKKEKNLRIPEPFQSSLLTHRYHAMRIRLEATQCSYLYAISNVHTLPMYINTHCSACSCFEQDLWKIKHGTYRNPAYNMKKQYSEVSVGYWTHGAPVAYFLLIYYDIA